MLTKLTYDFINKVLEELKKEENKTLLEERFLSPLSENISLKIHPYMMTIFCMYILILILIISILFILIKKIE